MPPEMPPNGPFPFPFPLMFGAVQQGGNSATPFYNTVPARVQVAMKFLVELSYKTQDGAAVSDVGIEIIPGQELSIPELKAQAAACDMLTNYFKGHLSANEWEEIAKAQARRMSQSLGEQGAGQILYCPLCLQTGRVQRGCKICQGSGRVLTFAHFDNNDGHSPVFRPGAEDGSSRSVSNDEENEE